MFVGWGIPVIPDRLAICITSQLKQIVGEKMWGVDGNHVCPIVSTHWRGRDVLFFGKRSNDAVSFFPSSTRDLLL